MATKDISRTIMEGGRARRNKDYRRKSNQKHRGQSRDFAHKAKGLVDADDLGVTPKRDVVNKDFDDKFGAMKRWLGSHVGKPWNDVFSEICRKINPRSLGGKHARDHMLNLVTLPHERDRYYYSRFFVDDDGILQKNTKARNRHYRNGASWREIDKWADGRRVMDYGNGGIFWMVPEKYEWQQCGQQHVLYQDVWWGLCHRFHKDSVGLKEVPAASVFAFDKSKIHTKQKRDPNDPTKTVTTYFREIPVKVCKRGIGLNYKQGHRFNAKDLEMWGKLTEDDKHQLLWVLPKEVRKKRLNKWSADPKRLSDYNRYAYR